MNASKTPGDIGIQINPELDRTALGAAFRRHGRIHIPGFLTAESAQRIHKCLVEDVPWNLVFNDGEKHFDLAPEQWQALDKSKQQDIRNFALTRARSEFQYFYNNYPISDAYQAGIRPGLYLNRLHEFVNSALYLDFIREITGIDTVTFADSQATAYGPGHFLTEHHDDVGEKNRRLAYVLNLTPRWLPDWGGALQFLGGDGNIEAGFLPCFNALNMFAVPARHLVGYVAPFADGTRLAITGWIRDGECQWQR